MGNTCYELMLEGANIESGKIYHLMHTTTMKKFIKDTDAFASALVEQGFVKGDVLTLYLPTCLQAIVAFYACSKIGVVANIVHPLTPIDLLKENMKTTSSKGLVFYDVLVSDQRLLTDAGQILIRASASDYAQKSKVAVNLYAHTVSRHVKGILEYDKLVKNKNQVPVTGSGEDTVCTMHSGGTSGVPKIIRLSNENFNSLALNLRQMYAPDGVGKDEVSLVTLPVFHAYGLGVSIHTSLTLGFSLNIIPKFSIRAFINAIESTNVTFMAVVPVMLRKLMQSKYASFKEFSKVKVIWCGGDAIPESLVENINAVLAESGSSGRVMRGYGLTEVAGVCAVNNFTNYRKNSCGKPIPNTKIEIWDDNGEKLPHNTIGEIVVSSACVMQGYVGGGGLTEKNGEKYLLTGDVGYLDEDGYLYVVDRKKRSFKISAINVFPAEIEQLVCSIDYINEACAVAVHYDDKPFIKVFVTLKEKVDQDKVAKDVIALCEEKLIKYSVPSSVEVIEAMPLTGIGKIDYRKLQSLQQG